MQRSSREIVSKLQQFKGSRELLTELLHHPLLVERKVREASINGPAEYVETPTDFSLLYAVVYDLVEDNLEKIEKEILLRSSKEQE